MACNQNDPNNPFWGFIRSFDQQNNNHGAGVDRPDHPPPGFPFGGAFGGDFNGSHPPPPPHGPHSHPAPPPSHGPHSGPHSHPHDPHHHPPPPGSFPFGGGWGGHDFFGGPRGFHGGPGRRGGRGCGRRGGRHGEGPEHFGPGNHHRGQGPPGTGSAFDLNALLASLADHPLAQAFRTYAEQFAPQQQSGEVAPEAEEDEENTFTPPIDIFSTESHFILHVALPGAKKEDVGINWDVEKGALNIAGVIYRQGDEEFLKSLTQSERKVGVFERSVRLPPAGNNGGEKEEVDGDAITAKLEDGVLVVTVPKVEKEWTDVKKVDIE